MFLITFLISRGIEVLEVHPSFDLQPLQFFDVPRWSVDLLDSCKKHVPHPPESISAICRGWPMSSPSPLKGIMRSPGKYGHCWWSSVKQSSFSSFNALHGLNHPPVVKKPTVVGWDVQTSSLSRFCFHRFSQEFFVQSFLICPPRTSSLFF